MTRPSDRFDLDAITKLAQDMFGQIPSVPSPVQMPIHPTAAVPVSAADLQTVGRSPSSLEHHANILPWQMLAQQTGAVIKVIPITDRGEINDGGIYLPS